MSTPMSRLALLAQKIANIDQQLSLTRIRILIITYMRTGSRLSCSAPKVELKEDIETAPSLGFISQEPDSMLGRTLSQTSTEGVADFTKVFKEDTENDECVISAMESIPISYVERDTGIELEKPYESQDVPTDCEYFKTLKAFNFQSLCIFLTFRIETDSISQTKYMSDLQQTNTTKSSKP